MTSPLIKDTPEITLGAFVILAGDHVPKAEVMLIFAVIVLLK